ncbi:MAG: hypothetical protein IJK66_03160 [Bacilli bacterium]|nr:hypothetical protein [Bacilli bacterium]
MFGFSSLRCSDCSWIDPRDRNRYGEYYCTKEREYVSGDDYTCRDFEPNFYVMTAYCKIKKLPYNCDEMISLIALRDKYMVEDLKGRPFLEEYEIIGPILAVRLQADMYRSDIVRSMEEDYIHPAMEMMLMGDFDGAQESYIQMVEMLKIRYGYAPARKTDKNKKKDFKF